MILDTTYLLPLVQVKVKHDLLRAIAEGRVRGIDFDKVKVSLISLFELQAKASKLGVDPMRVYRAISVVYRNFEVIPFYEKDIIVVAHGLRGLLRDYIDRVILATAITLKEPLVTEDRDINRIADNIQEKYGVPILKYNSLLEQ